jgi:hypothetical protein
LTSVEQSLVEHVSRGELLDLAAEDEAVGEAAMRSWGDTRAIRATVIRDILRGRLAPDPDPHGLRLRGARITGRLDLENLSTYVSLQLSDCHLEEGIVAMDARLAALILTRCRIEHPAEPPLDAVRVTCGMLSLDGARIIGHTGRGAVELAGARLGGQLYCDGAELRNDSGPALSAFDLHVDQGVYLTGGFTATGSGAEGAVSLVGARIGGQLDCEGAELRNDSGPALVAYGLQVDQEMLLTGGFTAEGSGGYAVVDLRSVRVGGTLYFDPGQLTHADDSGRRIEVGGLTYTGVPEAVSVGSWLRLLRDGTTRYAAQPYQQLAAGCRAQGHERQAREVLIAQRRDQLARTDTSWPERLWGRVTEITLGYGYQPWRVLLFLAGTVALSIVLAIILGAHGALAQTSNTADPGRPCTVIQRVSVGLDLYLPVPTSLARTDCDLAKDPASATAAWLTAASWVIRLLLWAFAALFIAGFTGAVRKT